MTHFTDFDITFPSIGPADIVFQAGGRLYLLDLATEKASRSAASRWSPTAPTLKPRTEKVDAAHRVRVGVAHRQARGLRGARRRRSACPAEHGPVVNLTRSSGVAERYPRWSPDGKTVAYWSDRGGEYELAAAPG